MQSCFPSSVIAYSWSYTLPRFFFLFAQRHLQKCAVKESERNCVDGWSSSHNISPSVHLSCKFFQTTRVCSSLKKKKWTVYSSRVFGATAWGAGRWREGARILVLRAESFIEKGGSGNETKPQGTDLVSPVLTVSFPPHTHTHPPTPHPDSVSWSWLHSAEAVTGWMASRLAVMLLKARGVAMSQLWGDRALPLAGCHVGPVT